MQLFVSYKHVDGPSRPAQSEDEQITPNRYERQRALTLLETSTVLTEIFASFAVLLCLSSVTLSTLISNTYRLDSIHKG